MASPIESASHYVFSATWAASFVPPPGKGLIDLPTHYKLLCLGLWPSETRSNGSPQTFNTPKHKKPANCMPYAAPIDPELKRKLKIYMCSLIKNEAAETPWRKQWYRHGCLSGLSTEEYWNLVVDVCERFLNPTSEDCILNKLHDRGIVPGMDVTSKFLSDELSAAFGYQINVTVGKDEARCQYYFGEIRVKLEMINGQLQIVDNHIQGDYFEYVKDLEENGCVVEKEIDLKFETVQMKKSRASHPRIS